LIVRYVVYKNNSHFTGQKKNSSLAISDCHLIVERRDGEIRVVKRMYVFITSNPLNEDR